MSRTLSNGVEIPDIGFGTWALNGEACVTAVKEAIEAGYRLIDTASWYGNEKEVGQAIRNFDRSELFIISKCWKDQMGKEKARTAFEQSLKDLGTDYIDLYLIHWPSGDRAVNIETWQTLVDLYKEGKCRAIGVSNFNEDDLLQLFDCEILPMADEILFDPGNKQRETRAFCHQHHIQVIGYQPLGRGKILGNFLIRKLADKYNVSPAQICLSWEVAQKVIPIPKSSHVERMKENLEYHVPLTDEEIEQIDSLPPQQ